MGTSKITISGRVFSPEISPLKAVTGPVIIPAFVPTNTTIVPVVTPADTPITESTETRGKDILVETFQKKAQSVSILEDSKKKMEEILNIIKKRDYNMVERLR